MGDFVIFLFDSAICVETVVNGSDFFRVKKKTHTHTKYSPPKAKVRRFGPTSIRQFWFGALGLPKMAQALITSPR
jgi:hypothetical protein